MEHKKKEKAAAPSRWQSLCISQIQPELTTEKTNGYDSKK